MFSNVCKTRERSLFLGGTIAIRKRNLVENDVCPDFFSFVHFFHQRELVQINLDWVSTKCEQVSFFFFGKNCSRRHLAEKDRVTKLIAIIRRSSVRDFCRTNLSFNLICHVSFDSIYLSLKASPRWTNSALKYNDIIKMQYWEAKSLA